MKIGRSILIDQHNPQNTPDENGEVPNPLFPCIEWKDSKGASGNLFQLKEAVKQLTVWHDAKSYFNLAKRLIRCKDSLFQNETEVTEFSIMKMFHSPPPTDYGTFKPKHDSRITSDFKPTKSPNICTSGQSNKSDQLYSICWRADYHIMLRGISGSPASVEILVRTRLTEMGYIISAIRCQSIHDKPEQTAFVCVKFGDFILSSAFSVLLGHHLPSFPCAEGAGLVTIMYPQAEVYIPNIPAKEAMSNNFSSTMTGTSNLTQADLHLEIMKAFNTGLIPEKTCEIYSAYKPDTPEGTSSDKATIFSTHLLSKINLEGLGNIISGDRTFSFTAKLTGKYAGKAHVVREITIPGAHQEMTVEPAKSIVIAAIEESLGKIGTRETKDTKEECQLEWSPYRWQSEPEGTRTINFNLDSEK
jgi:hypothetical protein